MAKNPHGQTISKQEHEQRVALVTSGRAQKPMRSWAAMAHDLNLTEHGLKSWYYKHSGIPSKQHDPYDGKISKDEKEAMRWASYNIGAPKCETDRQMGARCGTQPVTFMLWRKRRGLPSYRELRNALPRKQRIPYMMLTSKRERLMVRAFMSDLKKTISKAKRTQAQFRPDAMHDFLDEWVACRSDEAIERINQILSHDAAI